MPRIHELLTDQPDHGDKHVRKVGDIHVGNRYMKIYPNGAIEEWLVVKGPGLAKSIGDDITSQLPGICDESCVIVNVKRSYRSMQENEIKFLADAGVVPYSNRGWSQAYLVRID